MKYFCKMHVQMPEQKRRRHLADNIINMSYSHYWNCGTFFLLFPKSQKACVWSHELFTTYNEKQPKRETFFISLEVQLINSDLFVSSMQYNCCFKLRLLNRVTSVLLYLTRFVSVKLLYDHLNLTNQTQ